MGLKFSGLLKNNFMKIKYVMNSNRRLVGDMSGNYVDKEDVLK